MSLTAVRRERLTRPIFRRVRKVLPSLSQTEREALEAGEVWWDAALFAGDPDWQELLRTPAPRLTDEERAFLDGPVEELCAMVDEWDVTWERGDLPAEAWDFMKREKFFGMIMPKDFGGLGFSAYAHSEVVRKISSRSVTAAVTVMVPNSLGPGELLLQFGTDAQRERWLPRLAAGEEVPCFGLTSPEAGSDAAAMTDRGEVFRREDGSLGIRLDFEKRYITLAPVATVLGLAFKLHDPEHLLGEEEDLGITVALVPMDTPGVERGERHLPSFQMFQNGPVHGSGVEVPLDAVIGGEDQIGKGWKLLMSALAAGRGISLPSLSAAGAAFSARTTGEYARIREQFGLPIGKFEGVQEPLARMAGTAYLLDGARRLTCAGLDEGRKLAVISAIMKAQATFRMRASIDDAMDVHGGKAVIDGPSNYLGSYYRAIPVGITVEGANIVTRSLIIFGQGAIRCHPHLLDEMLALEQEDEEAALRDFDRAFWAHVGHSVKTFGRAWVRAWSGGRIGSAPKAGKARRHYRRLARYAAALALVSDLALLTLGGALKRREMLSARLGDVLSELYLLSGALKRWEDDGRPREDLPLLNFCMARGAATIERRLDETLANFPNRFAAGFLRLTVLPFGVRARGPGDDLTRECAELLMAPSATRDRLGEGLYLGADGPVADLERAFALTIDAAPLRKRLREAGIEDWREARERDAIDAEEAELLERREAAVARVIAVDDFPPGAFAHAAEGAHDETDGNSRMAAAE